MIYNERKIDLFTIPDNYYLVQCISSDFACGKGISVEFNNRFNIKNILLRDYKSELDNYYIQNGFSGKCIQVGKVFNLITKVKYWNKPTLETMKQALLDLKEQVKNQSIKYLAMPLIGCGLDRLNWNDVSELIKMIFNDLDIEILVCKK